MKTVKAFGKWLSNNWERVLFSIVGLVLLGFSLYQLFNNQVAVAGTGFVLAFVSFLFSNLTRYKRIKGWGFEAEMWEDKQKEASDLIERLREVVSIYTREVIVGKVTSGRWGTRTNWHDHWKLYDDLVTQHNALGQKIDFTDVKKTMDDYFLFDMTTPEMTPIRSEIQRAHGVAQQAISEQFGSPIKDVGGYSKRLEELRRIPSPMGDPFQFATKNDLAGHTLKVWEEARDRFKRDFGIDLTVSQETIQRLERLSGLYLARPVVVTEELIEWGRLNQPN